MLWGFFVAQRSKLRQAPPRYFGGMNGGTDQTNGGMAILVLSRAVHPDSPTTIASDHDALPCIEHGCMHGVPCCDHGVLAAVQSPLSENRFARIKPQIDGIAKILGGMINGTS